MSIDLNSLLRDAADDGAVAEPATGHHLLARARQQSRRRRHRRVVIGATVVATAGAVATTVVLGAGSLSGLRGADEAGPEPDSGVGAYQPIELTVEEAVERCGPVLDYYGYSTDVDWKLASASQEVFAGSDISLVPADGSKLADGPDSAPCQVPFTEAERARHWVTEPIADSGDTEGVLRQCGAVAGYDFAGWEIVTAVSAAQGTEAVLRSTNDYVATCSLEPDWGKTWAGPPPPANDPIHKWSSQEVALPVYTEAEVDALPPLVGGPAYSFHVDCRDTRKILTDNRPPDGLLCSAVGTLFNNKGRRATEVATIEVSIRGGGESFEIPVIDGYFAARFLDPAADARDQTYDYVAEDESGEVLGRGSS